MTNSVKSCRVLLAGVAAIGALFVFSSHASADTVYIADTYSGGINQYNGAGDIIANDTSSNTSPFSVFGMDVTRSGADLSVKVYTNYVNNIGTLNTGMGALFIGATTPTFAPGGGPTQSTDTFRDDPARFQWAVTMPTTPSLSGGLANGVSSLTSLPGTLAAVQQSYNPNPTDINGSTFRAGQAVGVIAGAPGVGTVPGATASWSIKAGSPAGDNKLNYVEFDILNFYGPGTVDVSSALTIAWAMTCANDVILALVPPGNVDTVPLPAGLPLFVGGLGLLGLLGNRSRRRRLASA
jgi:hypothetical protein